VEPVSLKPGGSVVPGPTRTVACRTLFKLTGPVIEIEKQICNQWRRPVAGNLQGQPDKAASK
jgi:hypothetical protein